MTKHYNITGNTTKEIFAAGSNISVSSIWIANVHASNAVTIDLFVEKKLTGKFYYLKGSNIGVSSYLQLENININGASEEFSLYIKLNNSDSAVDVILK
jgi:hypothetical protein